MVNVRLPGRIFFCTAEIPEIAEYKEFIIKNKDLAVEI